MTSQLSLATLYKTIGISVGIVVSIYNMKVLINDAKFSPDKRAIDKVVEPIGSIMFGCICGAWSGSVWPIYLPAIIYYNS